MKKARLFLLSTISFFALVAYQNCSSEQNEIVGTTNPNSNSSLFLEKLNSDSEVLVTNNSCSPDFVNCEGLAEDSAELLSCLQENADRFYQALACQGYVVKASGSCHFAISNENPQALEPLHIEGTCFYDNQNPKKALHLDVCTIESVPYNPNNPSIDTVISAWLEIGNQRPFSRFTKTVSYYPEQSQVEIDLVNLSEQGEDFLDACSKQERIEDLRPIFTLSIQN